MSLRQLWAVTRKEVQHIYRDKATLVSVLLTPTIVLLLMAYALTVDLNHIPIVVLDQDRSQISRQFIQQIVAGDDLELYTFAQSLHEVEDLLMRGEVKAAIVLAPAFGEQVSSFESLQMQIIIDGTEPESGGFALEHIAQRTESFITNVVRQQLSSYNLSADSLTPIDLRVRTWYNPSLKPRVDMIPGLISLVLGFPALSVALTLAHEHEHGTMEQLMATPVGKIELLIGKMIPYILVGLANVIFIPILAIWWFNIPFKGNFLIFLLLSIVFLFSIMSMGIVLGTFIRTQAAALALSFLVVFFPGFFLTGIFFPIVSMPEIMRLESIFLPGTHYATITRGVFLTGIGLDVLLPSGIMLVVIGMAFVGLAALFFKKRLA